MKSFWGFGKSPWELSHSISKEAITKGAISSISIGLIKPSGRLSISISTLNFFSSEDTRCFDVTLTSTQPADWIFFSWINLRIGCNLDS